MRYLARKRLWYKLRDLCALSFERLYVNFSSRCLQVAAEAKPDVIGKQYKTPALRKLTPEQANLLLIGQLSLGSRAAKDLLDVVCPDPCLVHLSRI